MANNKRGAAIPIPKTKKLRKLAIAAVVVDAIANKTINEAGLQGRTINPKKKPNTKEQLKKNFKGDIHIRRHPVFLY